MALRRKNNINVAGRPKLLEVRPLTREDLGLLKTGYQIKSHRVRTFRDSHHRVARLLAAGIRAHEVAEATGYSINSIYAFQGDPSFKELIASARQEGTEAYRDIISEYEGLLISNRMKAERRLADRLDDEDEDRISTRDLITLARDAADRTGFGKRVTNTNINIDLAKELEAASARRSRSRTIDHVPTSSPATLSVGSAPALTHTETHSPQPLRSALINRRGF